jgi:hypothetical protein
MAVSLHLNHRTANSSTTPKPYSQPPCGRSPIEGGQATKILEGLSSYISLAIVNGGVYFVPLQRPSSIRFLSFTTNQIRPVSSLEKPIEVSEEGGGLAVSPDGRWILCTQFDQAGSELMLVENFR